MRMAQGRPARWLVALAIGALLFTAVTAVEPRVRAAYDSWRGVKADEATRGMEHFGDLTHVVFVAARSPGAAGVQRGEAAAKELIQVLPTAPGWFEGRENAYYYSHLVLGRLKLAAGDTSGARAELLEAGRTSGSFGLAAYGPDMTLAQELLERGDSKAVLEYLAACSKFWSGGEQTIREWSDSIQAGHQPDFGRRSGLSPRKATS